MFFTQFVYFFILSCTLVFCQERGLIGDATCLVQKCSDITKAVQKLFPDFVKGSKNWKSSEVLAVDVIQASLPSLTYTYYNATLSGLSSCKPVLVRMFLETSVYEYSLLCSKVVFRANPYESYGLIGPYHVEARGSCSTVLHKYEYKLKGQYTKFTDKNNEEHIMLKNFVLDAEAKGKITYDYTGIFYGKDDKKAAQVLKFANKNYKIVDQAIRQPIISEFMKKYVANMNDFLRVTPMTAYLT